MITTFQRLLDRIDWLLSRIAAAIVLAVMAMIVCDVFGRYVFSRPLPWVYDVVSIYVINIVLYFMVSEVLRTQSHIELDLEVRLLPPKAWAVLQAIAWLAVAVAVALVTWVTFQSMVESFGKKEVHPGLYEWPVWVEKATVCLGLALLTLRILTRCALFVQQGLDATIFHPAETDHATKAVEVH